MPYHSITILIVLVASGSIVWADGCKFATDGRMVPEREQRAFIDWSDGVETLHVAALSDPTGDGSVWIVPIRASASAIQAEPVDEFPTVVYYETLRYRAVKQLREAIAIAGLLDTGGFCCMVFGIGGGVGCSSRPTPENETSRVEKLGMIVTVVSADARIDLEHYFDSQGVNRTRIDLSSLDPYFGRSGYAFICGWVPKRGEPVTATGLKIVFPSPTIWFPLQATRSNTEPVETVVYVRRFMKPADGCKLPGLRCEYIYGVTELKGVHQSFKQDEYSTLLDYHFSGRLEQITRVTLNTDPHKWNCDLELVPGTTPVGTASLVVIEWGGWIGLIGSVMLGALLGLIIPWTNIGRAERLRRDWLAGVVIGTLIVFSILACLVAFSLWRWQKFMGQPRQPRQFLVLPLIGVAHFLIVMGVCKGLISWIETS